MVNAESAAVKASAAAATAPIPRPHSLERGRKNVGLRCSPDDERSWHSFQRRGKQQGEGGRRGRLARRLLAQQLQVDGLGGGGRALRSGDCGASAHLEGLEMHLAQVGLAPLDPQPGRPGEELAGSNGRGTVASAAADETLPRSSAVRAAPTALTRVLNVDDGIGRQSEVVGPFGGRQCLGVEPDLFQHNSDLRRQTTDQLIERAGKFVAP